MAKLPPEVNETVGRLKQQSLEIVDEATAAELAIFEIFGETEATLPYLDEVKNVGDEATTTFSQLSTLELRIAQAHPNVTYRSVGVTSTSNYKKRSKNFSLEA